MKFTKPLKVERFQKNTLLIALVSTKRHSLYNNYTSILEYEKYINHKIYLFLFGGTSALEKLYFDKGERKHLIEQLYKLPVICSFLELLFGRYKSTPIITKNVDVESIKHNNNISNRDVISTTGPSESSSFTRNDEDCPRESLVDTTLSLIQIINRFSSWAVKSSSLVERLLDVSVSEYREIKNWYWNDLAKKQGIKGKIYLFLLGGTSALEKLYFDKGKRKYLIKQLYKCLKELPVPYFVGLIEYLTKTVPVICSFLELLFDRDLSGNLDLYGYVPLFPNSVSCDFGVTDLCYLSDATCKSDYIDECTVDDIKISSSKQNQKYYISSRSFILSVPPESGLLLNTNEKRNEQEKE
ncbi:hypothetical protein BCR32DRAFT_281732 [Anaeromyces robustus]|uniref:Uncharacterized protein n=1 Tax=Anaeromyces robustus TaxID=1754192 RepID=A0A1Y1X169_9FUNG|nr:hypothetical protein BCR32DRAFT_281732 [Anaeromyces robustus]|eukprot:ORX79084.1 hypothetical protein BCR32DRAFT_281732 [Anaeromyces robustus]